MSVAVTAAVAPRTTRPSIAPLALLEARRFAMRASLWAGWAATVLYAITAHTDWPGGSYESAIPLSFSFLVLGVFVAAVRTGSRDVDRDLPPLAEEAALDGGDRLAARLLALTLPVALAALTAIGITVAARLEGGFWLGDGPRRTDSAAHTVVELLQPVLVVALAGAIGVVVGHATHRTALVLIVGVFTWALLIPFYWVWNSAGLYPMSLVQVMPLRVPLPRFDSITDTPANWYVEFPGQYQPELVRDLVHVPTVVFHDLYLLGVTLLVAAPIARDHRRAARVAGGAVAIGAVIAQWLVSPF